MRPTKSFSRLAVITMDPAHLSSLAQTPDRIECQVPVVKKLISCEHEAVLSCSTDPSTITCGAICGKGLGCCSKTCKATCSTCSSLRSNVARRPDGTDTEIPRVDHIPHSCGRSLFCSHDCIANCSPKHRCGPCQSTRLRTCSHDAPLRCSGLDAPCK